MVDYFQVFYCSNYGSKVAHGYYIDVGEDFEGGLFVNIVKFVDSTKNVGLSIVICVLALKAKRDYIPFVYGDIGQYWLY
jgi:hypothetical protein